MVHLRAIHPSSKLATTPKGMKMHYIPDIHALDRTEDLQLGGFFSPGLEGPAPSELIESLIQNPNPAG
jgi:hypothetical protein